jgi:GrpB-like predicted nucleotidyltransferase (UPF0157 family)/quercetin dioxygenase-like cupin family protein
VQVFRFDAQIAMPITRFGSLARVAPLTAPDGRVGVQVLHLPPDGLVGRHPAAVQQLFAVVAGNGWVTGDDGRRHEVGPGDAVVWSAGEEHESGSDDGMVAVVVEGTFDIWATSRRSDLTVEDHDPVWAEWFEQLRTLIWPAVDDLALRIDHVGSTAVPGLAAKPIVDMDIVVPSRAEVPPVIERLSTIGYRWRGDLGIPGREAFRLRSDDGRPRHHLYVVVEGNDAHLDHVLLRDLLREDAEARARYGELKRRAAADAVDDIDAYLDAKAPLVEELLARARMERGLPPATRPEPDADGSEQA